MVVVRGHDVEPGSRRFQTGPGSLRFATLITLITLITLCHCYYYYQVWESACSTSRWSCWRVCCTWSEWWRTTRPPTALDSTVLPMGNGLWPTAGSADVLSQNARNATELEVKQLSKNWKKKQNPDLTHLYLFLFLFVFWGPENSPPTINCLAAWLSTPATRNIIVADKYTLFHIYSHYE